MPTHEHRPGAAFWREAFELREAATSRVLARTLVFALVASVVTVMQRLAPWLTIGSDVMAGSGVVLGLLLVFRTAAGYDRWWEARTLWGAIANQSLNFVTSALAYGPRDPVWQDQIVRWVAAFTHVARATLRDERSLPAVAELLGVEETARIAASEHMPGYVAGRIAALLEQARQANRLDGFAFQNIDRERAALLDHVGGCERILETPIPKVYSVTIRRVVVLYLCALPFALGPHAGLLAPVYLVFLAYPILSLEQIGAELQNPFVTRSLSHLDLEDLCLTIERDLRSVSREARGLRARPDRKSA